MQRHCIGSMLFTCQMPSSTTSTMEGNPSGGPTQTGGIRMAQNTEYEAQNPCPATLPILMPVLWSDHPQLRPVNGQYRYDKARIHFCPSQASPFWMTLGGSIYSFLSSLLCCCVAIFKEYEACSTRQTKRYPQDACHTCPFYDSCLCRERVSQALQVVISIVVLFHACL